MYDRLAAADAKPKETKEAPKVNGLANGVSKMEEGVAVKEEPVVKEESANGVTTRRE